MCGLVGNANKEVIVAGGLKGLDDTDVFLDSVEILSIESMSWRLGEMLNHALSSPSMVDYAGNGLISGGLGQSESGKIFEVSLFNKTENESKILRLLLKSKELP